MEMTMFWLLLIVAFVVFDAMTLSFGVVSFAFGALGALVAAAVGGEVWLQVLVFLAGSTLFLLLLRPLILKRLKVPQSQRFNADAIIGERGLVTRAITPEAPGAIKVRGQEWSAVSSTEEEAIPEGASVRILEIRGVRAVVAPAAERRQNND